jgi:hypothetical protein
MDSYRFSGDAVRQRPRALARVKLGQPNLSYHLRDFFSDRNREGLVLTNLRNTWAKMARILKADI